MENPSYTRSVKYLFVIIKSLQSKGKTYQQALCLSFLSNKLTSLYLDLKLAKHPRTALQYSDPLVLNVP